MFPKMKNLLQQRRFGPPRHPSSTPNWCVVHQKGPRLPVAYQPMVGCSRTHFIGGYMLHPKVPYDNMYNGTRMVCHLPMLHEVRYGVCMEADPSCCPPYKP